MKVSNNETVEPNRQEAKLYKTPREVHQVRAEGGREDEGGKRRRKGKKMDKSRR